MGLVFLFQSQAFSFVGEKARARKERKEQKIKEGKPLISPLAGPAYTPELGGVLAATALISFKTNPKDSLIQRSSSPVTFGASTTGALFFSNVSSTFWFRDKVRIYSDLWVKDMPDNYWGVGYEKARNVEQGDSTTAYQRFWSWFNPRFLYQFKNHHFLGLNVDLNYTQASEVSPGMQADPEYQRFKDKPFNAGMGVIYQLDSRDMPVNAWRGNFLNVSYSIFRDWMGSQNKYEVFILDFRTYHNIGNRKGSTLALQTKSRLARGNVPWGDMSQLGTPFDLRGYTWGRYRDESLIFGIVEYRFMFLRQDKSISKHGLVGWLGTGSIAKGIGEFNSWIPNFGLGYRFEVQPRMNLRIDIGMGQETAGFYFNFNEAF